MLRCGCACPSRIPRTSNDARRGWIASLSDPVISATDGRVVWNADAYAFLDAECPDTVNPSLWRQGQLAAIHGPFEVTEGIYQVRSLDLSIVRSSRATRACW